jgi:hypothetical protein
MADYDIFARCNACGDLHPMGISVALDERLIAKQSIADMYGGEDLPPNLAALKDKRVYCPKTARQDLQKDSKNVFLVPTGAPHALKSVF